MYDTRFYALHERPYFIDSCCDLLNSEWPRSKTARLRSLNASSDTFPISLLMTIVDSSDDSASTAEEVIGHSKISQLPNDPRAAWIESVVVSPSYRGKGLGARLMMETEKYAIRRGLVIAYLSTIDQQKFYSRLGYDFCEPVSCTLGGSVHLLRKSEVTAYPVSSAVDNDRTSNTQQTNDDRLLVDVSPPPYVNFIASENTHAGEITCSKLLNIPNHDKLLPKIDKVDHCDQNEKFCERGESGQHAPTYLPQISSLSLSPSPVPPPAPPPLPLPVEKNGNVINNSKAKSRITFPKTYMRKYLCQNTPAE